VPTPDSRALYEHDSGPVTGISIGTMHLGKGLEFKAVAVIACDDEVLPLQARVRGAHRPVTAGPAVVCTENLIRIDWPKESPNVSAP
jgi:superfamily I DNA/RNA helicase